MSNFDSGTHTYGNLGLAGSASVIAELWAKDPTDLHRAQGVSSESGAPGWYRQLCIALMDRTLTDIANGEAKDAGGGAQFQARDARRWVESADHGVFGFVTVCEVMRLDPEAVRARLLGDGVRLDDRRRAERLNSIAGRIVAVLEADPAVVWTASALTLRIGHRRERVGDALRDLVRGGRILRVGSATHPAYTATLCESGPDASQSAMVR